MDCVLKGGILRLCWGYCTCSLSHRNDDMSAPDKINHYLAPINMTAETNLPWLHFRLHIQYYIKMAACMTFRVSGLSDLWAAICGQSFLSARRWHAPCRNHWQRLDLLSLLLRHTQMMANSSEGALLQGGHIMREHTEAIAQKTNMANKQQKLSCWSQIWCRQPAESTTAKC